MRPEPTTIISAILGSDSLLPTFFVIGAAKAGTSSLHYYLGRHPQIAMTNPKEPHVLLGDDHRERAQRYATLFDESRPIRGESSTGYSAAPYNPEVPGNIADLVPDARLVYLVRDPVDRAIAHYAQDVIAHRESRAIEEALAPGEAESHFIAASCYATQLEAYLEHFARDAILVLDSRRLRARRRQALAEVFAHVGADAAFWDEAFQREHVVRADGTVRLSSRVRGLQTGALGDAYRRIVPERARERIRPRLRRLLGGREVFPEASPELRERLKQRLAPEANRFRALTGQKFERWSV